MVACPTEGAKNSEKTYGGHEIGLTPVFDLILNATAAPITARDIINNVYRFKISYNFIVDFFCKITKNHLLRRFKILKENKL